MNKILINIKKVRNNVVINNIFHLIFIRFLNYLLPLLLVPYLISTIGIENFGLINFANSFVNYFFIITEYGFNLTGTREIALVENDIRKLKIKFSSIIYAKFLLATISAILFITLCFMIPKLNTNLNLFLLSFLIIFTRLLTPNWFFQAIEKMKYLSIINTASKIILVILILVFVKTKSDLLLVPTFFFLSGIVTVILSFYFIRKRYKFFFIRPNAKEIMYQLKLGFNVFISSFATNLYGTSNIFILGIVTNNVVVGYFTGIDRIIRAISGIYQSVVTGIYPFIVKKLFDDDQKIIDRLKKLFFITLIVFSLIFAIYNTIDKFVIKLVFGELNTLLVYTSKILSLMIIILPLAMILSQLVILPFKQDKIFRKTYISAAVLNFSSLIFFYLINQLNIYSFAFTSVFVEFFITAIFMYYSFQIVKRNKYEN